MTALAFEYKAFDASGKTTRGVVEAISKADAFRLVQGMGLTPTSVRRTARTRGRRTKVKAKDLAHFTYQIGVLLSAKIPLTEGLSSIADQERDGPLRRVVQDIAQRVSSGEGIAAAFSAHQATFGEVFVESVRAAERSGSLGVVLDHLADMLEKSQETTRQVRSALLYPTCVVTVLGVASVFLVGVIVPKFGAMFAKHGASLPFLTRVLLDIGQSIRELWWGYATVLLGLAVLGRWLLGRPGGRQWLDRTLHRVPVIGGILRGLGIARFSRVLGIGLSSGLGLIEAILLAGKASGRPALVVEVERMAGLLQTGARLSDCVQSCTYFPRFARRMLSAGDRSGEIPRMCGIVARHYERECEHMTKDLSGAVEPLLIVGIAGMVLIVALAIFLPMWDMAKLVG